MKIALDAMGGDHAPGEIVRGGIMATKDFPDLEIVYVGDKDSITRIYKESLPAASLPEIVHTTYAVKMNDSPLLALRENPDNSISKSLDLCRDGVVQGFVSAGNTGACVAGATLMLRMVKGVQRPGIACSFPTAGKKSLLLDCGANVNARPRHLLEYAILGSAFLKFIDKRENVKVGLLNIGEEAAKGNDFVKETYELLQQNKERIGFIGNVEARDLFSGEVDVIVCEGFVGNSVLKASEGVGKMLMDNMKDIFKSSLRGKLAAALVKDSLYELKSKCDADAHGGAPLLGVKGNVIISHGSSSAWGVRNAIRTAHEMIEVGFNENLQDLL
jgi:glycerol-3-phosphate acyltransferase PlsX